jgi:hypothetical protein
MLEIEGVFVAPQTEVNADLREDKTPGYSVANARIGVNIAGFAAFP